MASRYPTVKVQSYCYNPIRLVVDNCVQYVPCGKCNGCLLHKSNEWSMRVGCEIESCPFPIFFTLTYMNEYLPIAKFVGMDLDSKFPRKIFSTLNNKNWRYVPSKSGDYATLRTEDFITFSVPCDFVGVDATNYVCDQEYFPYSSKRDFQLYLKLLRKSVNETFPTKTEEQKRLRYFAISEYGETLLRPHIHGVIFAYDSEVSEYLLYGGLYASWKMCRYDLFTEYCHLCDSGCRGYITQYLTCGSNLPQIYKDDRIRPWRLSSKNPSIGYSEYDKEKVFEDVISGSIEFVKDIRRIDERYVLRYPSSYCRSLFPKCYEFGKSSYNRLCAVYGLYFLPVRFKESYEHIEDLVRRLSSFEHSSDSQAAKACFKLCGLIGRGCEFHTYLYALDMYYYKADMYALKWFYEYEEYCITNHCVNVFALYSNLFEYYSRYINNLLDSYQLDVLALFVLSFGLTLEALDSLTLPVQNLDYVSEVDSILVDMVKMPKFNEQFGFSPNSVGNF